MPEVISKLEVPEETEFLEMNVQTPPLLDAWAGKYNNDIFILASSAKLPSQQLRRFLSLG